MPLTAAEIESLLRGDSRRGEGANAESDPGLGNLFTCEPSGDFLRIRTPYLYPDGDNIDLFCKAAGDGITVTDLGETNRWLRSQTLSLLRSPEQNALIVESCLTHAVEHTEGMLLARWQPGESLAAIVERVAQMALRLSRS